MQDSSFVAEVDIPVSVFVRRSTTNEHQMVVCGANEVADIGVSHQGTQDTLLPGATGPFIAAKAGTSCKTYGETKTCEIIAGAPFPTGSKLKPDANGQAIAAGAGEKFSAISNQAANAAGERIQVTIQYGTV